MTTEDACAVAHSPVPARRPVGPSRLLIAVFSSPVAGYLLRYGADLGYTCLLVEPDKERAQEVGEGWWVGVAAALDVHDGLPATGLDDADVVVTDHHRDELAEMIAAAIEAAPRWIGVIGNPRHPAPYLPALRELGVAEDQIALVHRPIGLNIGSRRPPEIAIATLAGLIAERNGRPGGFEFAGPES
jgi:xanthine dehydrogenase accessory factor